MKFEHQYQIPFVGLKQGLHRFSFEVNDEFFANFEGATIKGANIKVEVDFDKKTDFFMLTFYISGEINADCDRCTLIYAQEILDEFSIYVKFDDRNLDIESTDEDVIFISRADSHIDVAQLIYDFVNLSVPMQLICAKNRNTTESCNPELTKFLTIEPDNTEENIDQRWSALKKLKK